MSKFYVGDIVSHVSLSDMMSFIKTEIDKIQQTTGVVLTATVHEGQTVYPGKCVETVFTVKVMLNGIVTPVVSKAAVTRLYQSLLDTNQHTVVKVFECPDVITLRPKPATTD